MARLFSGFRAAVSGTQPSLSTKSLAFGGVALFAGATYFSYRYAKAHTVLRHDEGPVDLSVSFRVFDKLADKYDEAIGQEEAALWYGMMRKRLLSEAHGDVLEVSVGTGRNFQYYNLDSDKIKSLTFTDLSHHMLLRAEDKWFDEMQLGHKHPNVRTTFCLADAHCLVDRSAKAAPAAMPMPATVQPKSAVAKRPAAPVNASDAALDQADSYSPPWWAYWRRMPPSEVQQPDASVLPSGDEVQTMEASGVQSENIDTSAAGDPVKGMPGLHAGGLMNIFRVLLAPSKPEASIGENEPSSSDAVQQTVANASTTPASNAQAGPTQWCSCEHAIRGYTSRCDSGKLESGAPLQRFAPGRFDTVVDTFGLCSHEDPVQALREMAQLCKLGGKILLLEHGRSHYTWLNNHLDAKAENHQRTWGCLWNRDILSLVHEAGLQVSKVTRWHFGTSYFIIAHPPAMI